MDDYTLGYWNGLRDAADMVEEWRRGYSTPAAVAALGAAMDRLREVASDYRADPTRPEHPRQP